MLIRARVRGSTALAGAGRRPALWRRGHATSLEERPCHIAAQRQAAARPQAITPAASKAADVTPFDVTPFDDATFERPGWAIASPPPQRPLAALAALSAHAEDYPDTGYVVNLPV